jgi:hypothetical protein
MRRQTRFPVSWPVIYRGDEFLAEGTVLDLTQIGWRIAGSMPVEPGMQLTLAVWAPDKLTPIRIERATVLWVNGCEFAIEAHEMAPSDHTWVNDFLKRKLGLSWTSRNGQASSSQLPPASLQEAHSPLREHQFLATQTNDQEDEDEDLTTYDQRLNQLEGLRIVREMLARKVRRELTGEDSIANN